MPRSRAADALSRRPTSVTKQRPFEWSRDAGPSWPPRRRRSVRRGRRLRSPRGRPRRGLRRGAAHQPPRCANVARHLCRSFGARARALVLIGSLIGDIAAPTMASYVISKWGVRALGRQLPSRTATCPTSTSRSCPPAASTPPSTRAPRTTSACRPPTAAGDDTGTRRENRAARPRPTARPSPGGTGQRPDARSASPCSRGSTTSWSAACWPSPRSTARPRCLRSRVCPHPGLPRPSGPSPDRGDGDPAQPLVVVRRLPCRSSHPPS